ncbi:MAG: hypothetical protein DRJ31_00060 [Candidatus Methanomethylicota archaeon]|uniref:DNA repair and recombination protein RadB n=1 Tax=Thermoproteota archaeon TaxID=2056631 RepID=A0A497ETM3_9CREN|nr:MAG: hypothetical protein DRJ31_00060 [Candidatus Verstraetearchaeota archaeon]
MKELVTGIERFDEAIKIPIGEITTVFGESGSGKTNFVLQVLIQSVLNGFKPIVVYCDGVFPATRLLQMVMERGIFRGILEHLTVVEPKSFEEQDSLVDLLKEMVSSENGLVVFDSITKLYRAELKEDEKKNAKLNQMLNRQLATLLSLAKEKSVAVVVTSQVRAILDKKGEIEPVANKLLTYWSKLVIKLEKLPSGIRKMVFIKPSDLPSILFKIEMAGITVGV